MLGITKWITKLFYKIRTLFWNYPERLFFGNKSYFYSFSQFYQEGIPLSHFAFSFGILLVGGLLFSANVFTLIKMEKNVLMEGVVMGVDENGETLKINRINPLINTNIQLEKDLSELIYESLIVVTDNGEIQPVLADYVELKKGIEYQFKLRDHIFWQDGEPITVADVEATFNLIRTLEENATTSTLYSRSAQKIDMVKFENDDRSFKFVVKNENILPAFFEAISFKILPKHLIGDLNKKNILFPDPYINRFPLGSGPYKLDKVTDDRIELVYNEYYFEEPPGIKLIRFRLFPTEKKAFEAIQSGQIHSITRLSLDYIDQLDEFDNLNLIQSRPISTEYWGVYFNLAEGGPEEFKNIDFRKAFVMSINKTEIVQEMKGLAEPAYGPIAEVNSYFVRQKYFTYDPHNANIEFNKLGWGDWETDNNIRRKEGKELRYTLITIDNPDRLAVAEKIKENLAKMGVQITVEKKSVQACINDNIIPRRFDLILWGMKTLIDPDRYELFHSNNIKHPGLNMSSYVSTEKRTQVVDGKTLRVPAVDDDLDDGRRIVDEKLRIKKYDSFQKIMAKEVPLIFLFHPKELYIVNKRVHGVDLSNIKALENRFDTIENWSIIIQD